MANKFAEIIYKRQDTFPSMVRAYIEINGGNYMTEYMGANRLFKKGVRNDTNRARNWARFFDVSFYDIKEDK